MPPADETCSAADDICDVLVIGGGPAGSTAAALLAGRGVDVVLLERDAHPRFHIGESLLPGNLRIFERLGIAEQVAAIGVHKPGAEFISDATGQRMAFPFAHSLVAGPDHAYQVRRSEFDRMLFEAARARGARTAERTRVTDVAAAAGGRLRVTASTADGTTRGVLARFVLDASGRDTFMASRLATRRNNKRTSTAAVFAHFRNVAAPAGGMRGAIGIHLARDGWFWMIPLPDGVTSVGFVGNPSAFRGRRQPLAELFARRLRESPSVGARMAAAERISEVMSAANYAYRARRSWGDRWLMIGDAFGFIDPVFSSGVLLAMTAAEQGADVASAWLCNPQRGAALARRNERRMRAAMDRIGWLIYRINTPALRELFLSPSNRLRMYDSMIALLAGNLRLDRRTIVPVVAFRCIYYVLSALHRMRPPRTAA